MTSPALGLFLVLALLLSLVDIVSSSTSHSQANYLEAEEADAGEAEATEEGGRANVLSGGNA